LGKNRGQVSKLDIENSFLYIWDPLMPGPLRSNIKTLFIMSSPGGVPLCHFYPTRRQGKIPDQTGSNSRKITPVASCLGTNGQS
jgi:hypothetical protein